MTDPSGVNDNSSRNGVLVMQSSGVGVGKQSGSTTNRPNQAKSAVATQLLNPTNKLTPWDFTALKCRRKDGVFPLVCRNLR